MGSSFLRLLVPMETVLRLQLVDNQTVDKEATSVSEEACAKYLLCYWQGVAAFGGRLSHFRRFSTHKVKSSAKRRSSD